MKPCPEYDLLLTEHAAEALPEAEAERVTAHLTGCAACRAERDALAAALRGAALPPVSALERRAVADLPETALAALRRSERRRWVGTRLALGAIAACAAFLLVYGGAAPERRPVEPVVAASLDSAEPSAPLRSGRTEGEIAVRAGGNASASLDSAEPAAPPGSGRTEMEGAAGGVFFRGPPRASIRIGPAPKADAPTANGFAPATAGDAAAVRRWEGPDLEILWEDTDVLEIEGGLDL